MDTIHCPTLWVRQVTRGSGENVQQHATEWADCVVPPQGGALRERHLRHPFNWHELHPIPSGGNGKQSRQGLSVREGEENVRLLASVQGPSRRHVRGVPECHCVGRLPSGGSGELRERPSFREGALPGAPRGKEPAGEVEGDGLPIHQWEVDRNHPPLKCEFNPSGALHTTEEECAQANHLRVEVLLSPLHRGEGDTARAPFLRAPLLRDPNIRVKVPDKVRYMFRVEGGNTFREGPEGGGRHLHLLSRERCRGQTLGGVRVLHLDGPDAETEQESVYNGT